MKRAYIHTKNVGRVLFNDVYFGRAFFLIKKPRDIRGCFLMVAEDGFEPPTLKV